jgi:carbamoylphosphate synthase small subunit
MTAMPKPKAPPKEIDTRELIKKIRKPPAPPSRVQTDEKKYKRGRVRIPPPEDDV